MRHTILVVDDDRENLKFLKDLLESRGFVVHQAPSPEFAVSLLRKNVGRYSLAIIDYHMPSMMGDEATRFLQKIDRDLQVITISGDDSDEAFEKNLKAGSYLFLNRSVPSERLVSIVESYCKKFEEKKICFSTDAGPSDAETFARTDFSSELKRFSYLDICSGKEGLFGKMNSVDKGRLPKQSG